MNPNEIWRIVGACLHPRRVLYGVKKARYVLYSVQHAGITYDEFSVPTYLLVFAYYHRYAMIPSNVWSCWLLATSAGL